MSSDPNERLITRDPDQMEHQLEDADYAGASPDPALGDSEADLLIPSAGLGTAMASRSEPLRHVNPNPQYTPPSQQVSPHPIEGVADMPQGAPGEKELEYRIGDEK